MDNIPSQYQEAINTLLLEGDFGEAQNLLKMSIHSITEITDKATLTTLNDVTSHILKVSKFLANAPIEAKTFFATLTPNDKLYVMQHVEYLEDGIRFIDDSGKEICIMEKNDLEVPEKDLKKGKIEKHGGVTYFDRKTMMKYTKQNSIQIPTADVYEKLLRVMPAQDYSGRGDVYNVACMQLMGLLGVKGSGTFCDSPHGWGTYGDGYFSHLMTSTPFDANASIELNAGSKDGWDNSIDGNLGSGDNWYLRPVRALK